jgi:hypothetical protein
MFALFTFMGAMGTFILSDTYNEKHYSEAGLATVPTDGYGYVHIANSIITTTQVIACIMCALKVIHVPYTVDRGRPTRDTWTDRYIWATHEAVFLLIAAGVNSNALAEKFFESNFFVSIYDDNDSSINFIDNGQFHDILRQAMIYCRFSFCGMAWFFIIVNLFVTGKNMNWAQSPLHDVYELVSLAAVSSVFVTQMVYSVDHIVELYPETLIARYPSTDTPELIKERHLEFISENISELSLSLIGLIITWYSAEGTDQQNSLATTEVFNTFFLGFYGALHAVRSAFSVHFIEGDVNTAWVPLAVFIVGASISMGTRAISYRRDAKAIIAEQVVIFYRALGANYSPVSILWKLSLAGGIAALFVAGFSTQAQWFTFTFKAGSIPLGVSHLTGEIVAKVEEVGHSAFSMIGDLDPCKWTVGKHGDHINANVDYTDSTGPYNARYKTRPSSFALKDVDPSKLNCECKKNSAHCSCDAINDIKQKIGDKTKDKHDFSRENVEPEYASFNDNFKNWGDNSTYLASLKTCHSTECDIVLGVAIAAETAIFAADSLSFLPFVGEVVDTAAWFAQMGNRMAHNIITYSLKLAKLLQGFAKRLEHFKPLVKLLTDIEKTKFKESFRMSMDLLLVYLPLVVNGALCILIAFWRRENVHKMFQTYGVIVTFYIPLTILNATMYGLMLLFPYVIDDVVGEIPSSLFVVTATEHVGFTLLRKAYLMATIASFMLFVASLLDDAYYLRKKVGSLRNAIREIIRGKPVSTTAVGGLPYPTTTHDNGWIQATTICMVIPVLFTLSYHYEYSFVDIRYGPAGPLLKLTNSFHAHTNMVQDTHAHSAFVDENSLCGLIGKVVGKAISAVITDLNAVVLDLGHRLGEFTESVVHFSSLISTFEKVGTSTINVLEGTWKIAEKTIVLLIPMAVSVLITATAFVLPHVSESAKDEIEKTVKQLTLLGIYYNISMMVMMQQLFSTISNLKLHVFYFRFEPGPLVAIGYIATALNALALFSLYVNKIYKAK